MDGKKPWMSKTVWTNVVALVAITLNSMLKITGADGVEVPFVDLSPAIQTGFLALVNLVLRFVTKTHVVW